jgi:hypothetical protein
LCFVGWFGRRQVAVFQSDPFAPPAHLMAANQLVDTWPGHAPALPATPGAIEGPLASPGAAAPPASTPGLACPTLPVT